MINRIRAVFSEFSYLFSEFGVYVDSKGRRSRPADMKWSCLPLSFGNHFWLRDIAFFI